MRKKSSWITKIKFGANYRLKTQIADTLALQPMMPSDPKADAFLWGYLARHYRQRTRKGNRVKASAVSRDLKNFAAIVNQEKERPQNFEQSQTVDKPGTLKTPVNVGEFNRAMDAAMGKAKR